MEREVTLLPVSTSQARKRSLPLIDHPVLVALCFFVLYMATWAGHMDNGDSSYRIAWAKSMLFHHTARIDDAGLGAMFCKYSIGHSLLAMPFLAVADLVRTTLHVHAEGPIYMLLFVLNAAVFMGLLAKYLRLRFGPVETWRTLFLIGCCTVWLPCSRMDSIEQLTLTFLFAGFLLVRTGRAPLGMLVASYAIVIRPDAIVAVGVLGLWHLWCERRLRTAVQLGLACVPALLINAGANWVRWGTFREAGYAGEPFSEPLLTGLYGLLFSSGRSILIYSPPLLLGLYAVMRFARKGSGTRDYWFFAGVLASEILLYARWWDWSGDDCWALRFLTPGVILMCIPAAELLGGARWPRLAVAAGTVGFAVQALATLVDPIASDYLIRNLVLPRVALYPGQKMGGPNRVDIEDLRFNPRYSPLAVNWLMLRALLAIPPRPEANSSEIERTGTPLINSLTAAGWDPNSVECDLFWIRILKSSTRLHARK